MSDRVYVNAAMDAHFAVLSSLKVNLGRKPTEFDTAKALALAYGDAMGLMVVGGAGTSEVEQCVALVTGRSDAMVSMILTDDCVGSA